MKEITFVASIVGVAMISIAWLAEAKLSTLISSPLLSYNRETKVYQLHDHTPYASQTLEQKLLTIQSINRQEKQLAAKDAKGLH